MKMRPFELGLIVVFVLLMALALVFLSGFNPQPDDSDLPQIGSISIWGTLPASGMDLVLREQSTINEGYKDVTYTAFREEDFEQALINALADQAGPDLILAPHEMLVDLRRRIQPISYDNFPLVDIRSTYLDGAQIFALQDGLYAFPLAVDPLMMYYNRDILATQNLLTPPATWESLVENYLPSLILRNDDRTITRSVVALGEFSNSKNAFATLSMLLLQAGSAGVTDTGRGYQINLDQAINGAGKPLLSAADFFTRFSRPSNSLYSWNRSFNEDRARFISEDLALYFGFASEGRELEALNPNLNFAVAEVPQGAAANVRRTYGKFYGLMPLRTTDNQAGVVQILSDLGGSTLVSKIAAQYNLVPAYRSLVAAGSNDTYGRLAYQSAVVAYGWLNPNPVATKQILETMTKDINENRFDVTDAVSDALKRLQLEYN